MHSMSSMVAEKRAMREEVSSTSANTNKRRRVDDGTTANTISSMVSTSTTTTVGATELASALALASLATLSPVNNNGFVTSTNSHDAETRDAEGSWESRGRDNPVPISPEVRAPDVKSRKVHFAPGIKDIHRTGPRSESFPPRSVPQASRMPIGFSRSTLTSRDRPWAGFRAPPPQPSRQRFPTSPIPRQSQPPPPQSPQQPQVSQENVWICDYCNVASFPTYQEACAHEQVCRAFCAAQQPRIWHPLSRGPPRPKYIPFYPPTPPTSHHNITSPQHQLQGQQEPMVETSSAALVTPSEARTWHEGCVSLANPATDPEWLSELNCYIRETCIEAFSAKEEDGSRNTKRGRISAQQVGIRCCFCKERPFNERAIGAVSFPASVSGIYESVKRWQRVHLQLCTDIPKDAKSKLLQLGNANVWVPTTRQYWADSARSLGMVDTDCGIRFGVDVNAVKAEKNDDQQQNADAQLVKQNGIPDRQSIVSGNDMNMVPPYVYFLMRQVESCHFTEADRFVARSKGPVGYPGFQCRYCHGLAGLGKYFPVSARSLSTNSTSQNIHAHVLKCRKVPSHIKEQLVTLKEEKGKAPRLEPGWRKVFFDMVWNRLHPAQS